MCTLSHHCICHTHAHTYTHLVLQHGCGLILSPSASVVGVGPPRCGSWRTIPTWPLPAHRWGTTGWPRRPMSLKKACSAVDRGTGGLHYCISVCGASPCKVLETSTDLYVFVNACYSQVCIILASVLNSWPVQMFQSELFENYCVCLFSMFVSMFVLQCVVVACV